MIETKTDVTNAKLDVTNALLKANMIAVEALATVQAMSLYQGDRSNFIALLHCQEAIGLLQRAFEARRRSPGPQTQEERHRLLHELGVYLAAASGALGLGTGAPSCLSEEEIQKRIAAFDPDDPAWQDNYGFEL
jgi:hypothetical protein